MGSVFDTILQEETYSVQTLLKYMTTIDRDIFIDFNENERGKIQFCKIYDEKEIVIIG